MKMGQGTVAGTLMGWQAWAWQEEADRHAGLGSCRHRCHSPCRGRRWWRRGSLEPTLQKERWWAIREGEEETERERKRREGGLLGSVSQSVGRSVSNRRALVVVAVV